MPGITRCVQCACPPACLRACSVPGGGGRLFVSCSSSLFAPELAKLAKRVVGLLWCGQNPQGGLNSHCYVISSQPGLVGLWVVGGLSAIIWQSIICPWESAAAVPQDSASLHPPTPNCLVLLLSTPPLLIRPRQQSGRLHQLTSPLFPELTCTFPSPLCGLSLNG